MVKTYGKILRRMYKHNVTRILAIMIIIAVGICVVTGVCALPGQIKSAVTEDNSTLMQVLLAEAMADKIETLGHIFPVFFILVAVLTVLTTITRLVEEERSKAACLKTLGYSNFAIVFKYVLFALICSLFGCIIGILAGNFLLSPTLFNAIKLEFSHAVYPGGFYLEYGLMWSAVMIAAVAIISVSVSLKKFHEKPAALLRPKAPKHGKSAFIEKIPLVWRLLKFRFKTSVRNILRYKGRLIMTVVAVAGATALVFCGLGLFSALNNMGHERENTAMIDAIIPISTALVLCAIIVMVLVLFNLTNINIEERKKEIATLKVLGYNQVEVATYIYREVMILSVLGMIVGLPLGYFFLGYMFDALDFSSYEYVQWYAYVLSVVLSFVSVIVADVLLYFKIKKVDMQSSLKTVD